MIRQGLIDNLVTILYDEAEPEKFNASDRTRIADYIFNHFKSLNLSGIITSWN